MKRCISVLLTFFILLTIVPLGTVAAADTPGRKFTVGTNEYILTDSVNEIDGVRYFGVINTKEVNVSGSGTKARLMLEGIENEPADGVINTDPKLYYEYAKWGDTWWFYKSPEEYKETAFPSSVFDGYLGVNTWDMYTEPEEVGVKTVATDVTLPTEAEILSVYENGDTLSTTASTKLAVTRSLMYFDGKYYIRRVNLSTREASSITVEYIDASTQAQGWNTRSGYGTKEGGGYFLMAYVSENFFKEVKLDVNTLASGVKSFITTNFTKNDLNGIYSKEELKTLGFADDFVINSDLTEVTLPLTDSAEITGSVVIDNNTDTGIAAPIVIVAAYNEDGVIVTSDAVFSEGALASKSPSSAYEVDMTLPQGTASVSMYAVSAENIPYPLAESKTIGEREKKKAQQISAEPISATFNVDEMSTEISGTLEDAREEALLCMIFNPGKSFDDLTKDNAHEIFAGLEQISSDAMTGAYSVMLPVDKLEYKNYNVAVVSKNGENTDGFFYKDSDYETVALGDFKSLKAGKITLDAMYEKYSEAWSNDFIYELYNKLDTTHKVIASGALADEYSSSADAVADLNRQMAIQALNISKDKDAVSQVLGDYNHLIGLNTSDWSDKLEKEQKESVYTQISDADFENFTDLEEIYCKAVIIAKINSVNNYKDIKPILNSNKELVESYGIDMDKFSELKSTDFAKSLAETFESWDDFQEHFDEKAEEYEEELSNKKTSSKGSGGGGGGSRYVTVQTPVTTPDTTPADQIPEAIKPSEDEDKKSEVKFSDVDSTHWASKYINALATEGVVSGKDNERFCPDDSITREEFVKILTLAMGFEPVQGESVFTDVKEDAWYAPFVNAAYANGIAMGKADGTFGTGELISREDAAAMLHRALKCQAVPVYDVLFDDDDAINGYAREAIYCLSASGALNGVGNNLFAPKKHASRAEAVTIIYLGIKN